MYSWGLAGLLLPHISKAGIHDGGGEAFGDVDISPGKAFLVPEAMLERIECLLECHGSVE